MNFMCLSSLFCIVYFSQRCVICTVRRAVHAGWWAPVGAEQKIRIRADQFTAEADTFETKIRCQGRLPADTIAHGRSKKSHRMNLGISAFEHNGAIALDVCLL